MAVIVPFTPDAASDSKPGATTTGNPVNVLLWHAFRLYTSVVHYLFTWDATSIVSSGSWSLRGDAFGFRQVIVAATDGILYGLDSSNGRVLWRRLLGLGWAGENVGGRVVPIKLYITSKKVGSENRDEMNTMPGKETALLVAQRIANNVRVVDVFQKYRSHFRQRAS